MKPYWPSTTKVSGSFSITTTGSTRVLSGNGIPIGLGATVGNYPFNSSNELFGKYDHNSGSIVAYTLAKSLPKNPTVNSSPTCLTGGALGYTITGTAIFSANDAAMRDAPAYEILDSCGGHPVAHNGLYHYHSLVLGDYGQSFGNSWGCLDIGAPGSHGNLIGYLNDGFGIYGPYGAQGETLKTSDLDECHGHVHSITWDGVATSMFHYHGTADYPYTISCFKGTPIRN